MKKRIFCLILALVMFAAIGGHALAEGEAEPAKEEVIVLFTNDTHCGVEDGMGFAGVGRIKAALEAQGKNVILVDNGDATQGDVIGTLSKGEAIVELMNATGYTLAAVGNHEFDYGVDQLLKNVSLAKYQYLCCNFTDAKGNQIFDGYKVIEIGGQKIGFVGITTPQTFRSSTPTYFMDDKGNYIYSFCEGNEGKDLYDAVQKAVDAARAEGAEIVIAMAHLGNEAECVPWTSSEVINNTNGINIVLDAHEHAVEPGEEVLNKDGDPIIFTSTGTKFANLGMLTIGADGSLSNMLIGEDVIAFANVAGILTEDGGVGEAVAAAVAKNEELVNKVVAHTDVDLIIKDPVEGVRIVRSQETNLGDLCADAYRAMGEADIAFVNGGGVRDIIKAGDITYGQIIKVHPFGNAMCVVTATGQEILDALELSAAKLPGEYGGFLQISGMKITIDVKIPSSVQIDDKGNFVSVDGARRVKDVVVLQADGSYAPIDPAKTYTVACHNYLLKQAGDGYTMFQDNELLRDEVMIDNQVLINYIVDVLGGTVGAEYADPYGQGRITILD